MIRTAAPALVRIDADPAVARAAWRVASRTQEGVTHDVALMVGEDGGLFWDCCCPGFTYRDDCYHVTAARKLLAQERRGSQS